MCEPYQLFDLHCDTIGECCGKKQSLCQNELQLSIDKCKSFTEWVQVFAIWIPDERRGDDAFAYYCAVRDYFLEELRQNQEKIKLCSDWDGRAKRETGLCHAILAVENASVLGGRMERLAQLSRDGVKLITLTWNGENELGSGALSGRETGLTDFGKAVLREMSRLHMAADVSHLNEAGFYEVAQSGVPMLASHSNANAVWPHARSLRDEQIRVLIEKESLMGICFARDFLGDASDCGFAAVLRQIQHVLALGGENILAIGSDYDGANIDEQLGSAEKSRNLYFYLKENGLSIALLQKIFYQNAQNYFTRLQNDV